VGALAVEDQAAGKEGEHCGEDLNQVQCIHVYFRLIGEKWVQLAAGEVVGRAITFGRNVYCWQLPNRLLSGCGFADVAEVTERNQVAEGRHHGRGRSGTIEESVDCRG
jgi:hypothetical protein